MHLELFENDYVLPNHKCQLLEHSEKPVVLWHVIVLSRDLEVCVMSAFWESEAKGMHIMWDSCLKVESLSA